MRREKGGEEEQGYDRRINRKEEWRDVVRGRWDYKDNMKGEEEEKGSEYGRRLIRDDEGVEEQRKRRRTEVRQG